jgi:hypothetical protein
MTSFKQFLEEGRDAPLYHATRLDNIDSIIQAGLKPTSSHFRKKLGLNRKENDSTSTHGISFTRDFKIAHRYGQHYFVQRSYVIFKFDQRKLTQRYKSIPVDYFSDMRSKKIYDKSNPDLSTRRFFEAEKFIITKNPIPLSFATEIFVPQDISEQYLKLIQDTHLKVTYFK